MNKLPLEVIREHIIPYTYSPQNDELLDDIKSFYIVRNLLLNIYYCRWKEAFMILVVFLMTIIIQCLATRIIVSKNFNDVIYVKIKK